MNRSGIEAQPAGWVSQRRISDGERDYLADLAW
jgi:hypothetical protein